MRRNSFSIAIPAFLITIASVAEMTKCFRIFLVMIAAISLFRIIFRVAFSISFR